MVFPGFPRVRAKLLFGKKFAKNCITRMHSSRMCTGRSLTICLSQLPGGGPQRNQKNKSKNKSKNKLKKLIKKIKKNQKKNGGEHTTPPRLSTPPGTKYTPLRTKYTPLWTKYTPPLWTDRRL